MKCFGCSSFKLGGTTILYLFCGRGRIGISRMVVLVRVVRILFGQMIRECFQVCGSKPFDVGLIASRPVSRFCVDVGSFFDDKSSILHELLYFGIAKVVNLARSSEKRKTIIDNGSWMIYTYLYLSDRLISLRAFESKEFFLCYLPELRRCRLPLFR